LKFNNADLLIAFMAEETSYVNTAVPATSDKSFSGGLEVDFFQNVWP
jgi:hypothetical protein